MSTLEIATIPATARVAFIRTALEGRYNNIRFGKQVKTAEITQALAALLFVESDLRAYRDMCQRLREACDRHGLRVGRGNDYLDHVVIEALDKAMGIIKGDMAAYNSILEKPL